jgi:transcription initiation factor IIE alpha subunit
MLGPESDRRDVKISAILALCILFALIAAGLVSCTQWDTEEKQNRERYNALFKYQEGDVVYIKPDSSLATITNKYHYSSGDTYYIVYKTKNGELKETGINEYQIYSKK